jgi:hypothetical protein
VTQFIARHRFRRAEFDWLAFDRCNRVAIFTTAGSGPIPASLDIETTIDVAELIMSVERRCQAEFVTEPNGNHSEWDELARRGVFAYDWIERESAYVLIAKPDTTIELSLDVTRTASVTLAVDFEQTERFTPNV